MTSRQKIKNNKNLYLKIALSAAVLIFAAQAAVLFKTGSSWGIICVVFASAVFATLLFISNYIHALILCLAGVISAAVFSRDIIAVIWGLAYIPAGLLMFHGVVRKIPRTAITVRVAVFAGIIYAALITGSLIADTGGISPELIYQEVDKAVEAFVENNEDILLNMYIPIDQSGDEEERERRKELVKQEYAMNLKMMMPMIFSVYALVIAYFSTAFFRIIYNIFVGSKSISPPLKRMEWRIRLSAVSAVIIILCAILNLILIDLDNRLPRIIVTNIQYILAPGFCVMGIYFLFDKIYNIYNKNRHMKSGFAPAFILVAVCALALLILTYAGLAALVIIGLYSALIGDIKKFYEKTKKAVFGDEDDDDDI